jgi:4,5-DOPA dioxygenase extradiol
MASSSIIRKLAAAPDTEATMPALFIGHGNPMNAIEDTEFSRSWAEVARSLSKPKAVLCVSAHWETVGTRVTAMEQPKTIHDFYGFPPALFDKRYPAPGSPDLARMTQGLVRKAPIELDLDLGLDHGAWSVLCRMFPDADVPVIQLSLDQRKAPASHYELGRELRGLRKKGVLIIGSGNHRPQPARDGVGGYGVRLGAGVRRPDERIDPVGRPCGDHRLLQAGALRSPGCTHPRTLPAAAIRAGSPG